MIGVFCLFHGSVACGGPTPGPSSPAQIKFRSGAAIEEPQKMTQRLRMALKNHLFQWPFYAMLCHSMQPPWELCRLCTMFAVFASGKVFHASASACAWSRLRCAQQHDTVGSLCVCVWIRRFLHLQMGSTNEFWSFVSNQLSLAEQGARRLISYSYGHLLVITGYSSWIIHVINGVISYKYL